MLGQQAVDIFLDALYSPALSFFFFSFLFFFFFTIECSEYLESSVTGLRYTNRCFVCGGRCWCQSLQDRGKVLCRYAITI